MTARYGRLMSTVEEPAPRPQGWHPDPSGRHRLRWWDGEGWTAYAGDGVAVQWDPMPVAEAEERNPGMPGIVTALVAFVVGAAAGLAVAWAVASDDSDRAAEIALSSVALWASLVAACVLVSRRRGTGSFVRDYAFRFRWSDLGLGLAGSIAGRLVSGAFVTPIPLPSRSLNDVDQARFGQSIDGTATWLVLIAVTCVGAPLVEELFFRGLVQTRLVGRYGPVVGISVASLLFGAAHLIAWEGVWSLAYAWAVVGGGLVLGTTYHLTKRLGTSIVAHALFNAQAMLLLLLLR